MASRRREEVRQVQESRAARLHQEQGRSSSNGMSGNIVLLLVA